MTSSSSMSDRDRLPSASIPLPASWLKEARRAAIYTILHFSLSLSLSIYMDRERERKKQRERDVCGTTTPQYFQRYLQLSDHTNTSFDLAHVLRDTSFGCGACSLKPWCQANTYHILQHTTSHYIITYCITQGY